MDEPRAQKSDVKSEIANTLIEAMKSNNTPWQRPWSSQSMRPMNITSNNAYRGVNRILLSLSGRADPRWATYEQARKAGWQVRRGEKGSPIVKLVEFEGRGEPEVGSEAGGDGQSSKKMFALRRYVVFNAELNAEQIEGVPALPLREPIEEGEPVAKAEAVLAALKETGLRMREGGDRAFYQSDQDLIQIPTASSFHSVYDRWATILHECAHSTLHHPKRLDRKEALHGRWGDEAYAMEELRAEICSAILAAETGMAMSQAHIDNHAAYLNSWIKAISNNPMALFSAAKDAELMSAYMLELAAKRQAGLAHKDWVEGYDREEKRLAELANGRRYG
jgi:antirestriction protein ArdC